MSYRLEDDEQERKLFVGGLNKANTDEDVLKNYFESHGSVIDCTIMRDQDRVSRGFGFILFDDAAAVDKIMNAKRDGAEFSIYNHNLEIKRALPKVPGGNAGSSRTSGLNRKVFVGGLASTMTEEDLRQYFESYGRVNEVEILRDRETGKLRGFAFITFDEEDSANKCMQRRQHEICKKICEVKRAQTRSNLNERDGNRNRPGFERGDRQQQNTPLPPATGGGMSMAEVNQLIQQAFLLGQPSVQSAAPAPAANNSILLQALMNQLAAPAPAPAPVAPAPASNNNDLAQLAQLLQGRGIDANSLAGLLNKDAAPAPAPAANKTPTGYSTSYPSVSSYDYGYACKTSNYGPTNDDSKLGYRPY